MTALAHRPARPAGSVRPIVAAVLLASVLLPFAVTGPAVVLPGLAAGLHASSAATQWVQNAYNATFAATVLAAGSLADRLGRRLVLRLGIGVFAGSAAVVAVAPNVAVVDVVRGVQGLGAAGIVSAGAAVLAHATTGTQRIRAFGMLGATFGAGLAFGPLVAGALGQWRLVFAVVAAVAVAAGLAARSVPESRDPDAARIDVSGMACFGGSLLALSLGFVWAGSRGWAETTTLLAFGLAITLLALFVVVELRSTHPMFDIRLFRNPAFSVIICQPFSVTFGFVVLLVFLPGFLQGSGGRSPLGSALVLLPLTAPVLLVPLLASRLTARLPLRTMLVTGSVLIAAGVLGLMVLDRDSSAWTLALPLLVFGVGVGLAFCVMDNAAVSTVPVQKAGAAAGMFNTMRISGESLAVAAAAAALTSLTSAQVPPAAAADAVQGRRAGVAAGDALAEALHVVFAGLGILAALGALLTWWALRPRAVAG